ncbi:MAG TPA: ribosome maturation factor RimM [Gemmatimonadaceae bacterium]|nr:ribosome maturation factor RimM [Gemmatimonadaceae bacterium]
MRLAIIGRIRKAQGIKGELLVEPITDTPDALFASGRRVYVGDSFGNAGDSQETLTVTEARPFKDGLRIVKFAEIADRNAAELWGHRFLFAPEEELAPPAEDEVFVQELFGLVAESPEGQVLGRVADVVEVPQGILLEIARDSGAPVLVPYRPEMVREVRVHEGKVILTPVEGLFD